MNPVSVSGGNDFDSFCRTSYGRGTTLQGGPVLPKVEDDILPTL